MVTIDWYQVACIAYAVTSSYTSLTKIVNQRVALALIC